MLLAPDAAAAAATAVQLGVMRGCGRQKYGALVNFFANWVLGLPLLILLAFKLKLGVAGEEDTCLCGELPRPIAEVVLPGWLVALAGQCMGTWLPSLSAAIGCRLLWLWAACAGFVFQHPERAFLGSAIVSVDPSHHMQASGGASALPTTSRQWFWP